MDPKTGIVNTFSLVADGYDNPALRFFSFAGNELADRLNLRPGESVYLISIRGVPVADGLLKVMAKELTTHHYMQI